MLAFRHPLQLTKSLNSYHLGLYHFLFLFSQAENEIADVN